MRAVLINTGIYAPLIEQFLAHKRSLGHKMNSHEHQLHLLDKLTVERQESEINLSQDLVTLVKQKTVGMSESESGVVSDSSFSIWAMTHISPKDRNSGLLLFHISSRSRR